MSSEDPPVKIPTLPFKPPKFNWNASNLYNQFKLFKTKVEFASKGTYKENPGHAKVGAILNWLGNSAFKVYANFIWPDPADKDDALKVLKAFEDYFKPVQNKYHCWYSLGWIYSSQFVTIVIKKGHFKPLCRSCQLSQSGSRWKGSQSQSRKDQHEISSCDQSDDSSWYAYEQDSIQIVYNKGIHGNISLTFALTR